MSESEAPRESAALSDADLLARFQRSKNRPQSSLTLGFEMLALSQGEQWVEIAVEGKPEFCNPMGQIQGGFVAAMLDEAVSVAGQISSGMAFVMSTLEMKVNYLRPVYPGRCIVRGQVRRLGKSVVFIEGELRDKDGALCATASATALPREYRRVKPA